MEKDQLTAEMLLLWARWSAIQMEKPSFEKLLQEMRDDVETDPEILERY